MIEMNLSLSLYIYIILSIFSKKFKKLTFQSKSIILL